MEPEKQIERAYLEVYDTCAEAVFRHCFLRLRDREKARDLMQESFLRTWTYLSSGHRVDNIRAFVYKVANNLIIDDSRRKKESSLDALQEKDGFDAPDGGGTQAEESRIMAKNAAAALDSLPPSYKEVLTLRYLEEFTPKEIAEILNTSQTVVSVRIWRGIKKLKTLIPQ